MQDEFHDESNKLKWMLSKKDSGGQKSFEPPYGDLMQLNQNRLILNSVGEEILADIVSDYLDLLETSTAVYEQNGDYALGIFSSGWCQFLDSASRKLCNTDDNQEALVCGKWLCHESCWTQASKIAIENGNPVDIMCHGGLHIYALPIEANNNIIGAINFGYGDPPNDSDTLEKIASKYCVSLNELSNISAAYEPRPKFIIDIAKKRLAVSAKLVGEIVERKQAQNEFAQIFSMSLDMICIADINTATFIKVNPAFKAILGYSEEELIGKPFFEFIHPDDIETTRAVVEKKLKTGAKVINFENRYQCKDGRFRWLSWVSHPNLEKGVTFAVARDVTELKQNQEALKKSKLLLDATGRMAKVGGWELDIKTLEVTWTEETYRIHEVSIDKKPSLEEAINFFHPEDRQKLELAIHSAIYHGEPYDMEIRFITANGKNLWTRTTCQPENVDEKPFKLKGTFQDITDRKKAEDDLRSSEEKLRTVIDSNPFPIAFVDTNDEKILFWSQSAIKMFGHNPKVVSEWYELAYPDPDYRNEAIKRFKPFLVKAQKLKMAVNTGEYRIACQDGSIKICEIYAQYIPGNLIVTLNDITEFKRVEEELRNSERELQLTLDATADGIWSWNFKTNELYFSPKYYKMLGYVPNEFTANYENWANLIHPDDRTNALAVANEYLKTKPDLYKNEFRLRTKSGDYRWARTVAKVVERDENGDAIYMIGNHEDITERKLALDALIEEQKRFELAMQSVNDGLFDWNLKTNEIYYSPVWKKLLGYEDHEIENKFSEWESLTHPEDVKKSWEILNDVLEGKRNIFENEFKMLHKDGHWVDILARANIFFDEKGEGSRVIGTHIDITERKRLEKQIQQSQKMEAIGTLAGGIAHDFNNMLGIITGNISYALSSLNKEDELYDVLTDVQESSKQAQDLTQQLLTFSKGGAPIKKAAEINKIIKNAAIFSIRGAKSKCNFELSDDLWPSEVDEGQINQVINNLAINANQAMPNGGTITIRTENVNIESHSGIPLPAGQYVKIVVEDQGVGISKKHLSSIFEPYFTTKQKGSGLGLATTYSIIKRHDGHIAVYSEIEKGTVFNIYLPASIKNSIEYVEQAETKHKGKGRILVMDDQEPILKMVGRMLNSMGYETTFATDGSQAVEIYKNAQTTKDPFDAVILDLTIPGGMGGLKTIIELLKIDSKVKAIVSSGYSNDPIMSNYEDYGFCGTVPKPYTKNQLAEVLNKIFDGR